jgi:hypothetical protein
MAAGVVRVGDAAIAADGATIGATMPAATSRTPTRAVERVVVDNG